MADDGGDGVPAPDLGQLDALLSILNKGKKDSFGEGGVSWE